MGEKGVYQRRGVCVAEGHCGRLRGEGERGREGEGERDGEGEESSADLLVLLQHMGG